MNLFVFIIPANSGERIGYSLSVLLSNVVFLTLVSDNLPSTSKPKISYICYLLLADVISSSCIIVCTIIGLRIHQKPDSEKIPKLLLALLKCTRKGKKYEINDEKTTLSWRDVGTLYDKICFCFFLMAIIINYSVFFMYIKSSAPETGLSDSMSE